MLKTQILLNLMTVSHQVLIMFCLMGVGFLSGKTKLLNDGAIGSITNMVIYVVLPCLMVSSFQREFNGDMLSGFLVAVVITIAVHVLNIVVAHITVRDADAARRSVLRFALIFSNCGFMAVALENALLGSEGVFYGVAFISINNIFIWTYGLVLMRGGTPNIKKLLINPGLLSTLIGMAFFVCSFTLPKILSETLDYISAMNTPLCMFIVGYQLSQIQLSGVFGDKKGWLACVGRLLVLPLLALAGLYAFQVRGTVAIACMVAASAPAAALTTMFAKKFNQDAALSVKLVSMQTIVSIATMTFVIVLSNIVLA